MSDSSTRGFVMTQPSAAPGWYPDPENPSKRSYWTGSAWGEPPSGTEPEHSARRVSSTSLTTSPQALLQILVGILLAVAPLLPWVKVTSGFGSASRSGLDYSSDGAILLVIGLLAVVVGVGGLASWGERWSVALAGLVGGGIAFGLAAYDLHQVQQRINEANDLGGGFANASVGAGLILALVAAGLLFLNGAIALWRFVRGRR